MMFDPFPFREELPRVAEHIDEIIVLARLLDYGIYAEDRYESSICSWRLRLSSGCDQFEVTVYYVMKLGFSGYETTWAEVYMVTEDRSGSIYGRALYNQYENDDDYLDCLYIALQEVKELM